MTNSFIVRSIIVPVVSLVMLVLAVPSWAQDETELAKKLQNPVAALISVPLQSNWDFGIGPEGAMRYTLNVQPVMPISIGKDWNLITRTIVPVIYAESPLKVCRSNSRQAGDIMPTNLTTVRTGVCGLP